MVLVCAVSSSWMPSNFSTPATASVVTSWLLHMQLHITPVAELSCYDDALRHWNPGCPPFADRNNFLLSARHHSVDNHFFTFFHFAVDYQCRRLKQQASRPMVPVSQLPVQ